MPADSKASTSPAASEAATALGHEDAADIALAQACLLPSLAGFDPSVRPTAGWSEDSVDLVLTEHATGLAASAPVSTRGTARAFGYLCRLCWVGLRGQLVSRRSDRKDGQAPDGL